MRATSSHVSLVFLGIAGLAGNAVAAPPVGWIVVDPAKTEGIRINADGSRWEGGYKDGDIDRVGTFYIPVRADANALGYNARALPDGMEGATQRRVATQGKWIPGPITVKVPTHGDEPSVTFEGLTDGVALKGPGKMVRGDGFTLEGDFDYNEMPFATLDAEGYYLWNTGRMIASYAHGRVKASWSNGATFEGETLDHYLFDRTSRATVCLPSSFYGNGLLKRPGQPDYLGLVRENWGEVEPVSKDQFLEHIEKFGDCPSKALAHRAEAEGRTAAYNAEMEEGRQRANAMLAADLGALANRVANDAARVEAASRGSSVERDRENARNQARMLEIHERNQVANRPPQPAPGQPGKPPKPEKPAAAANKPKPATAAEQQAEAPQQVASAEADEATAKRLAHEQEVKNTMDDIQRKRDAEAAAAKKKAERENAARQLAQSKTQYLAQLRDQTKLVARTCPGGEGKFYLVGMRPAIKPVVVECLDVAYTASCPGNSQRASGVIKSFLGASTDCFLGDAAEISPQLACKASEVVVKVREVTECK